MRRYFPLFPSASQKKTPQTAVKAGYAVLVLPMNVGYFVMNVLLLFFSLLQPHEFQLHTYSTTSLHSSQKFNGSVSKKSNVDIYPLGSTYLCQS